MPAASRKNKKEPPVEPPSSGAAAPASGGRRKKKGQDGWPVWLWAIGALAALALLGRFVGEASEAPKSAKKAAPNDRDGKKTKSGGVQHFLSVALRLQEMTEIATTLKNAGEMNEEVASTLNLELTDIEDEIKNLDGKDARDLMAMVSVIRGTLYQASSNLTDEEVAKNEQSSYTYANPHYWDDYYKKTGEEERFDWYGSWDNEIVTPDGAKMLGDLLQLYVKKEDSILMFGCGNSDLSEKMYTRGYESITNTDISESLLEGLRKQHAALDKMQWLYMNGADMSFEDGKFEVIIDKGTLDAIEQNAELQKSSIREVHRVLRPGGVLVSVTYNDAAIRVQNQLEEHAAWAGCTSHSFERSGLANKRNYHLHACIKPQ